MKKVLFVQSSLGLGGIETFFVRLVKELSAKGVRPQFVFLYKKLINPKLLIELQKFSDVYYWQDLLSLSVDGVGEKAKLMLPLSSNKVEALFSDCEAIHVSNALTYLCAPVYLKILNAYLGFIMLTNFHGVETNFQFTRATFETSCLARRQ